MSRGRRREEEQKRKRRKLEGGEGWEKRRKLEVGKAERMKDTGGEEGRRKAGGVHVFI